MVLWNTGRGLIGVEREREEGTRIRERSKDKNNNTRSILYQCNHHYQSV